MSENSSEYSRRDLLRGAALSVTAAGVTGLSAAQAQHVHQAAAAEKKAADGVYHPKCFNAHEYATIQKLAGMIIPADDHSQGALEAGAPEFIDLLASQNAELAAIYTGGMAWLDHEMARRFGAVFLDATPDQRTAMLDVIAYRKNSSPELNPGIRFFDWVRRMTVDAFYTSRVGIDDLGFKGNNALAEFDVPADILASALERSGLA